ncbi:L-alanine-DL-glutamate epimerase-like enolase superfamily enzyme [Naumannella cuiyingiana]|uniref:L-alanine-DL-glutamate epimerase-like enolase superfamily enzyme n=1 Tax=Naumannella cuiyingiana TaxID=1347891 RepID=A0A7Z0ILL9_9ACTN|nr:L-alanine-DL-glutamate epimerase-like enolase superfamily enzyme [Naumannella cuiyingiana]
MSEQMIIDAVEAIPYRIDYRKPLRFASGEAHTADHVLVRVRTSDGVIGVADAPPRPYTYGETQASITAIIDDVLGPQVIGRSALAREQVHADFRRTVGNPAAKAALDMAIWDALGTTLGVRVSDLLGGHGESMRVSHMLGFDSPQAMVDEAERMRAEHGITTFKIKVGRRPWRLDTDVCRALREHFGDEVELYVDGNRGWSASEAAEAMRAMDDLGLTLAEELCPADDVLGRRWLVRQLRVPFVADESAARPGEITRELLGGAADAISIKTARTGFTESAAILGQCTGLGVEVVMGNQIDGQVGTMCTLAFGAAFGATSRRAGELSNFLDLSDDLLTEPLKIVDGRLELRTAPGIGYAIDEDKLTHYRQDR